VDQLPPRRAAAPVLAEVRHSLARFDYFGAYFSMKALAINTSYCES
jgi:hypothetical protein